MSDDRLGVDDVLELELPARELRTPVMLIALRGWFDASGVATTALDMISPPEEAITVGRIDPDPFFDFTVERPFTGLEDVPGTADEMRRYIDWPDTKIRLLRHPTRDLVVAVGVEPHLRWTLYSDAVMRIARRLGCRVVVTVGAHADAVPHTRTPPVVGSTTDEDLARRLGLVAPSYQGVTGLLGALLVHLDNHDVPAVSLRVGVPHYLPTSTHPRSVGALVTHLGHVLGVTFDVPLDPALQVAERQHEQALQEDEQLQVYTRMLETEFDRRAEAAIPSPDELGEQFEAYLREQTPDDDNDENDDDDRES